MDGSTSLPTDSHEIRGLLRKARAGDQEAINDLFERHRPYLHKVVSLRLDRRLLRKADASDIVQETLMDAANRLADYFEREPMPFGLWLRKTAQERVLMTYRKYLETARRDIEREMPLPEQSSLALAKQLCARGSSPSQQLQRRELVQQVRRAMGKLPEVDREILLIHTFEGLSYREAAYVLGVDSNAAKKRHGRALLRLHRVLVEDGLTSI